MDTPTPGGLSAELATELLRGLLDLPGAVGLEVTILDPDLDPDGRQADVVVEILAGALRRASTQA